MVEDSYKTEAFTVSILLLKRDCSDKEESVEQKFNPRSLLFTSKKYNKFKFQPEMSPPIRVKEGRVIYTR